MEIQTSIEPIYHNSSLQWEQPENVSFFEAGVPLYPTIFVICSLKRAKIKIIQSYYHRIYKDVLIQQDLEGREHLI